MTRRPPHSPARWAGAAHVSHGQPYWKGEGHRGLDRFHQQGKRAVDVDLNPTRRSMRYPQVRLAASHWNAAFQHGYSVEDGEHIARVPDGHGGFKPRRLIKIDDLDWIDVRKLVAPDGRHIRSAESQLRHAHSLGMRVEFEPKFAPALHHPRVWEPLFELVHELGADVQVKCLSSHGRVDLTLQAVKLADPSIPTILLPRPTRTNPHMRFPREWWEFVDYVRGDVEWVR